MEWTTLLGTALGALVGVGSTLLADRARWRRDSARQAREERKEIYVACLTTFRQAHEAMRAAATGDPSEQRLTAVAAAVREAFRESGCNEARETALICAPDRLADVIDEAFLTLRTLRGVLADGHPVPSDEYREARRAHNRAVTAAREAMRRDLGQLP